MDLRPEILYFGQSDYARSSLAHYATAYGNAIQRNARLSARWVLTASTPERLNGVENAVGIVRRATREALRARPGATERQIVHAEIGLRSYREFWGSYEACQLRPTSGFCVRFHDPPELTQPIPAPSMPDKAGFFERTLTRMSKRLAEVGCRGVEEEFLKRIDAFLCDSRSGCNLLAERFPELRHRIACMPPALIGRVPNDMEPNPKQALDQVCITLFGFLQRGKAIGEFLKALLLVHRRMPLVKRGRVIIRGILPTDASGRATAEAIEARIRDMGLRWLVEYRRPALGEEDLDELLRQTDILVMPYPTARCVTGSMTLLRAAAWCVAVVTTTAGAIPEFIEDEQEGIFYPAGNIQVLSEILEELIRNHARRMQLATNLRNKALRLWSPERVSELAADLYSEMLAAPREGRLMAIPEELRVFQPPEDGEALPKDERRRSAKVFAKLRKSEDPVKILADDGTERPEPGMEYTEPAAESEPASERRTETP